LQGCLKLANRSQPFTILAGHVEEVLQFKKFFFGLSIHALIPKI